VSFLGEYCALSYYLLSYSRFMLGYSCLMCFVRFLVFYPAFSLEWLYFDLPHSHPCYATTVEQSMSKNPILAQTTVGSWCTP